MGVRDILGQGDSMGQAQKAGEIMFGDWRVAWKWGPQAT